MKKSKIILLSTIALGVAAVGTTFAAYAVTDNANPFGIKVTPGELTTDSKTVSLAWGDTQTIKDLENLVLNKETSLGTVELLANTSDEGTYEGAFKMTLSDYTQRAEDYEGAKLVDYLQVTAYDAENAEVAKIATGSETKSVTKLITVAHATKKVLNVKVLLPNAASEVFDEIKNDVVYIEFDWAKGSEDDTNASDIYFVNTFEEEEIYCFAWNSKEENTMNAAWPGIKMDLYNEEHDIYKYTLATKYDRVIFNNGQSGDGNQTDDIEVTAEARTINPVYSNGSWTTLSSVESSLPHGYYLVGTMNNWTANANQKFEENTTSEGEYQLLNVTVEAGAQYKVLGIFDKQTWYGTTLEGNITIEEAGTYNFYFKPAGGNTDWPGYASHYAVTQ